MVVAVGQSMLCMSGIAGAACGSSHSPDHWYYTVGVVGLLVRQRRLLHKNQEHGESNHHDSREEYARD
eukprot:SAG31_NODE_26585_length_440_cov_0.448680_2_plen_67_part_01